MPRKSLAEQFLNEIPKEKDDEEGNWILFYDFKSKKPHPRFWTNLNKLIKILGSASMLQYSVFTTSSKRGIIAAVKLAQHYGAEIRVFKGEEVEV